ncbi:MAG: hypothetical protein GVY07_02345 [Bacteroidetes bacterium]|jgi:fido (protein-threonine AMPylation protein)|nr:hypothetical protein [Bacteroidota bacterium]
MESNKIDPSELQTAKDLLKDFAARPDLTAEEVYRISWSRYHILENAPIYKAVSSNWKLRLFKIPIYAKLPQALHQFMYKDLYTFAGQYRKSDDPNLGNIYFGRQHAHQRRPKFSGDPPDLIEKEVFVAVSNLRKWVRDPVYKTVRFYQKFVNVHPFYDGNGRIARLIANSYLATHGLTISWSEFDSKSKFIKRLNRCHLKPSEETFTLLTDYVKKYTFSFEELDS